MRWAMVLRFATAVVVIAATVVGCGQPEPAEVLRTAYDLGKEDRWDEAIPLIKRYVQSHPDRVDGHFLLGMAHMYTRAQVVATGIAEGEMQLALALYAASGDLGILAADMTPEEFKVAAQRETAYAHIWWIQQARSEGLPVAFVVPRLHAALTFVERGLEVDAESEELTQIQERIHYYLEQFEERNGGAVAL